MQALFTVPTVQSSSVFLVTNRAYKANCQQKSKSGLRCKKGCHESVLRIHAYARKAGAYMHMQGRREVRGTYRHVRHLAYIPANIAKNTQKHAFPTKTCILSHSRGVPETGGTSFIGAFCFEIEIRTKTHGRFAILVKMPRASPLCP